MSGDKTPTTSAKNGKPAGASSSGGPNKLVMLLLVATLGALFGVSMLTYQLTQRQGEDFQKLSTTVDDMRRMLAEVNANVRNLKAAGGVEAAGGAKQANINASDLKPGTKPSVQTNSAAEGDASDPDVVVLSQGAWEAEVNGDAARDITFVEFYAPWCGHCKKLTPEWQKLAAHFNRQPDLGVKIGKVDATIEKELAERYGVTGFPTLKLFVKGMDNPKDYSGERTADALQRYLEGQIGPSFVELKSAPEVVQFQDKNSLAVIGFVEPDSLDATMFKNIANDQREKLRFGIVTDANLASQLAVPKFPLLRMHRHFDRKKPAEYNGSFTDTKAILSFLVDSSLPLWGELTNENAQGFLATKRPLGVLFMPNDMMRTPGLVIDPLTAVAKKFESKMTFVYLNNEKFASHQSRLGLDGSRLPAFAIDDYDRAWKFPLNAEVTAASLEQFLDEWAAGRLSTFIRSAPAPASNDEPVKVVVGSTFEDIVINNDKDVLVEFYAPWCGHCKTLEPKWVELADKLKGVNSVVIAKVDATANDAPASTGISVKGFPTIYFFPGNAKDKPVVYDKGREVDEFLKYLKEKATTKFEL